MFTTPVWSALCTVVEGDDESDKFESIEFDDNLLVEFRQSQDLVSTEQGGI